MKQKPKNKQLAGASKDRLIAFTVACSPILAFLVFALWMAIPIWRQEALYKKRLEANRIADAAAAEKRRAEFVAKVEFNATNIVEQHPLTIIGSTPAGVEALLGGWATRQSNRSTPRRPIVYYIKDVEVIVSYQNGKAVGVAVIDKPGIGISPIPRKRFDELIAIIGGGQPKAKDILSDESGIREFSIGDAD